MSIFFIFIIASNARFAAAGFGSVVASISAMSRAPDGPAAATGLAIGFSGAMEILLYAGVGAACVRT